jgi:hypothetical protein
VVSDLGLGCLTLAQCAEGGHAGGEVVVTGTLDDIAACAHLGA